MKIDFDPDLEEELTRRIMRKFKLDGSDSREGIHLSDVIYCITKKWYDWKYAAEILPGTAMMFAAGLGLEKVLLEEETGDNRPQPVVVDGIWMSPDHLSTVHNDLVEFKSARFNLSSGELRPTSKSPDGMKDWPVGYIRQLKGYTYAKTTGVWPEIPPTLTNRIAVFLIIPARIEARVFEFEMEELEEFWEWAVARKERLLEAVKEEKPPEPFAYVDSESPDDYECRRCQYSIFCPAMLKTGVYVPKGVGHGKEGKAS